MSGFQTALDVLATIDDLRNLVGDPTNDGIGAQAGRAVCDAIASDPVGYNGATALLGGGTNIPRATGNYICGDYWGDEGIDPPVETPPTFTGGQCPCSRYDVNFGWDSGGGFVQQGDLQLVGPIFGVSFADANMFIDHGADACGGRRLTQAATGLNESALASARIISAIVLFGDPDDCGDAPPTFQPGPNNPGTPWGQPQTRPVGGEPVSFTPQLPDGDPATGTPFPTVDVPGFPSIPIPTTGQPVPEAPQEPARPGNPQEPMEPAGDVDDDITEEEEEEGFETIGYRWNFGAIPSHRGGIPLTTPRRFLGVFGNIQLRYEVDGGLTVYSESVSIRESSGSLIRPDKGLKVKGVSYNRLPDYGPVTLTPIRVRERKEDAR